MDLPTLDDWAERLGLTRKGAAEYSGACPLCGGEDRFHVKAASDGAGVLVPSQSEKWGKDHAMCTPASRGRAEMDGFRYPCISR